MDILLRTASTLARACSESAQRIEVRPTLRLSVHQFADEGTTSIAGRLKEEAETTLARIYDVVDLYNAQAEIRSLIGSANNEAVDRLLTERNSINVIEKYLNDLVDQFANKDGGRRARIYGLGDPRIAHDADEVRAALSGIRQRLATVTTGDVIDTIDVPSLPTNDVQKLRDKLAALRRRRTALNDELAAANLNRRIRLPDWVVATLRKHQIIE